MSSSAIVETQGTTLSHAQDVRRKQILAAARICFARSGFHGASMGQICSEATMSPGALYRYFPSKDSIIEAIAEEERLGAGECMEIFFGDGTLIDRLVLSAMDYLEKSIAAETGGLMIEIVSESIRNTAIGERFHAIESEVRGAIRAALGASQARGEIGEDVDLDLALVMLLALADGLVMRLQLERHVELAAMEPYLRRMISAILAGKARTP